MVHVQRWNFFNTSPHPQESTSDYVNRLVNIAVDCDFENFSIKGAIIQNLMAHSGLPNLRQTILDEKLDIDQTLVWAKEMEAKCDTEVASVKVELNEDSDEIPSEETDFTNTNSNTPNPHADNVSKIKGEKCDDLIPNIDEEKRGTDFLLAIEDTDNDTKIEDTDNDTKSDVKKQKNKEKFCDLCNCMVVLLGNDTMQKHYKSVHKQTVSCPYCEKVFLTKTYLPSHIKKHHASENSLILCSQCGFSTNCYNEYRKHNKIHTPHFKHVCDICNKMLRNVDALKLHKIRKHDKLSEKPSEMCSYCGKSYKDIKGHIDIYHKNKFRKCPDCEYTCKLNVSMKKHHQSVHEGLLEKCEDCGKEIKSIRAHRVRGCPARKLNLERLPCSKCDKTFSHPDGLKRHLRNTHSNIKNKMCTYCDYRTNVGGNLRMHISRVHEGNSRKTACKHCEKYVLTASMDWHIKTYHGNMQQIPALDL